MSEGPETPPRLAAVVVPIYADPPHDVVFIERARHLRRHAGEIAFPGGALDEADAGDHAVAALREVREEIGVPGDRIRIIDRLPTIRQRSRVFDVTPFVAIVDAGTPIVLDENEAFAVHRVPVARIVAPGAVHRTTHDTGEQTIETYVFRDGSLFVWGLTGRILATFVEHAARAGSPVHAALADLVAAISRPAPE